MSPVAYSEMDSEIARKPRSPLFINFDDRRTAAGLQVLGELSRKMQVIFLTHHDHLVPLAREVLGDELNVVTL